MAIDKAREIFERYFAGTIHPIAACREILKLRNLFNEPFGDDFEHLSALVSEFDHLPVGDERAYWSPEALREKDRELAQLLEQDPQEIAELLQRLHSQLVPTNP